MAKKPATEKSPSTQVASVAAKAMRTGKATPAEIRSMAARLESERAAKATGAAPGAEMAPAAKAASVAAKAMATGKVTPAEIRSMAGRLESERAASARAKAPKKK